MLDTTDKIEAALQQIAPDQVEIIKEAAKTNNLDPDNLSLAEWFYLIRDESEWDDIDIDSDHQYGDQLRNIIYQIPVKCHRTACQSEAHPLLQHRDNKRIYCPKCARKINHANNNSLFDWPTSDEIHLVEAARKG